MARGRAVIVILLARGLIQTPPAEGWSGLPKRPSNHSAEQERIAYLEKKIQTKDEVLSELMAEHVALKKTLGHSDRSLGSARYAGPNRGFRPVLVTEERDRRRAR
jgi:hypothetical protein